MAYTTEGCAIATVGRGSDGRHLLESCVSVAGSAEEQQAVIAGWLAGQGRDAGAISSVLEPSDYELMQVEAPDVLPAELKAAVRWRLKDVIGFPLEEAVVDVFDMPEPARRTGSKMMYAIAAKRQAITRQATMLKAGGRRFDVIDIPELALRNVVALLPEATEGLILLWLNNDSAQVLVFKETTLYLARQVQFAAGNTDGPNAKPPTVDAIALELQRSMDYFERHYDQAPLKHLIVAPRDEHSDRVALALAPETSMRIQSIDLARALDLAPGLEPADRRSLLAIGAALREAQTKL